MDEPRQRELLQLAKENLQPERAPLDDACLYTTKGYSKPYSIYTNSLELNICSCPCFTIYSGSFWPFGKHIACYVFSSITKNAQSILINQFTINRTWFLGDFIAVAELLDGFTLGNGLYFVANK